MEKCLDEPFVAWNSSILLFSCMHQPKPSSYKLQWNTVRVSCISAVVFKDILKAMEHARAWIHYFTWHENRQDTKRRKATELRVWGNTQTSTQKRQRRKKKKRFTELNKPFSFHRSKESTDIGTEKGKKFWQHDWGSNPGPLVTRTSWPLSYLAAAVTALNNPLLNVYRCQRRVKFPVGLPEFFPLLRPDVSAFFRPVKREWFINVFVTVSNGLLRWFTELVAQPVFWSSDACWTNKISFFFVQASLIWFHQLRWTLSEIKA